MWYFLNKYEVIEDVTEDKQDIIEHFVIADNWKKKVPQNGSWIMARVEIKLKMCPSNSNHFELKNL